MGISKAMVSLLCEVKREKEFKGKVLQLGKQDVACNLNQLKKIFRDFDYSIPIMNEDPNDLTLFESLGFDIVESMDFSDYEGADIIFDLNEPIPVNMKGQYDLIFDGGTVEHVFNFPQVLKNIYDMLKPDGIVIHAAPSHNHVDHGFYMFSPTVFYDFYSVNNYNIIKSYIFEYKSNPNKYDWLIYDYKPGAIDYLSFGGWGKNLLGIFFVAQKTPYASGDIIPQQGAYVRAWQQESRDSKSGALIHSNTLHQSGMIEFVKSTLQNSPRVLEAIRSVYTCIKKFKRPRIVARY